MNKLLWLLAGIASAMILHLLWTGGTAAVLLALPFGLVVIVASLGLLTVAANGKDVTKGFYPLGVVGTVVGYSLHDGSFEAAVGFGLMFVLMAILLGKSASR